MRIIGPGDIAKYEAFRDDIFGKKKNELKHKYRQQAQKVTQKKAKRAPLMQHPFVKKSMSLAILAAAVYLAEDQFKLVSQLFDYLQGIELNPFVRSTLMTIRDDLGRRVVAGPNHTLNSTINKHFPNFHFASELAHVDSKLGLACSPYLLSYEGSSRTSFGLLRFGNRVDRLIVDQHGNVVRQSKKSKFSLAGISFFGEQKEEVLEYETTLNSLLNSRELDITTCCHAINIFNRLLLGGAEYQAIYEECVAQSQPIAESIHARTSMHRARAEKKSKISQFIVNF